MKKYYGLTTCCVISCISSGLGLIFFFLTLGEGAPLSKTIQPFIFIFALITFTLSVVTFVVWLILLHSDRLASSRLSKEYKKRMKQNTKLPFCEIEDFSAELKVVREKYISEANKKSNEFLIPNNYFTKPYRDFNVLENGNIYYGYLVEANSELFRNAKKVRRLPAVVVYSTEEYYESNPEELGIIAHSLYENKNNNILKSENRYFSNVIVDLKQTNGRKVYVSTFFISSDQFPLNYITGLLFPIIANPENSSSVFMVNAKYWTDNLIGNSIHRDNMAKRLDAQIEKYAKIPYREIESYRKERDYIWDKLYAENAVEHLCERGKEELFDGLDGKPNSKICFGCVIATDKFWQSDTSMKKLFLPALVVYGTDAEYTDNPAMLITDVQNWLIGINRNELLKNFKRKRTAVRLAPEATGGRLAYIASVIISRLWLPEGKLTGAILPLVADTNAPENVNFIPVYYWSENFIGNFKGK